MTKRTIKNCRIIKYGIWLGEGVPKIIENKCNGYQKSEHNDEPIEKCLKCKLYVDYEVE